MMSKLLSLGRKAAPPTISELEAAADRASMACIAAAERVRDFGRNPPLMPSIVPPHPNERTNGASEYDAYHAALREHQEAQLARDRAKQALQAAQADETYRAVGDEAARRKALAAALAEAARADGAVKSNNAAIARLEDALAAAEVRANEANEARVRAYELHVERITTEAVGGGNAEPLRRSDPANLIAQAAQAELDVGIELQALRAGLAKHEALMPELAAALARAQAQVTAAAGAVLAAAAPALTAEVERLQHELIAKRGLLRFLAHVEGAPEREREAARAVLNAPFMAVEMKVPADHYPIVQRWRAARDALLADPDAALPGAHLR